MDNKNLAQRLEHLPQQIKPAQDLWPELAALLAATPQQTHVEQIVPDASQVSAATRWWYGLAASLLLSLLTWWQWPQISQPDEIITAAAEIESREMVITVTAHAAIPSTWQLMLPFETEKARLLAQLTSVPAEYGNWRWQLAIWQQASQQILQALQYQPQAPTLLRQLQQIQQQQLTYLHKLVQSDLHNPGAYL